MAGQKGFYMVLGGIAVAGVAWLGLRIVAGPNLPVQAALGARDTTGFTGYLIGDPNAPVEIVEYADFQCPVCADFDQVQYPDVKLRLIDTGKARLVYRDFPLDEVHPEARLAAHAAACADDQGGFVAMKDALYVRQTSWTFQGDRKAYGIMGDLVGQIGLDRGTWEGCMEAGTHAARIQASYEEGQRVGVGSTPSFLVDGKLYAGRMNSDQMVRVVDSLIAAAPAAP
jgi:protein-disulfide isomerase